MHRWFDVSAAQLVGKRRLPCLRPAPHQPPWTVGRLRPLLRTPERCLSSLEACRVLRSSPQAAPTLRIFDVQPAGGAAGPQVRADHPVRGGLGRDDRVVQGALAARLYRAGRHVAPWHRQAVAGEDRRAERRDDEEGLVSAQYPVDPCTGASPGSSARRGPRVATITCSPYAGSENKCCRTVCACAHR